MPWAVKSEAMRSLARARLWEKQTEGMGRKHGYLGAGASLDTFFRQMRLELFFRNDSIVRNEGQGLQVSAHVAGERWKEVERHRFWLSCSASPGVGPCPATKEGFSQTAAKGFFLDVYQHSNLYEVVGVWRRQHARRMRCSHSTTFALSQKCSPPSLARRIVGLLSTPRLHLQHPRS